MGVFPVNADGLQVWRERVVLRAPIAHFRSAAPCNVAKPAAEPMSSLGNCLSCKLSWLVRCPMPVDDATRTELEAAAFRTLVTHLRERTDVQNIDLMNLAGFCRNCLSNWLKDAADAKGVALTKDESREAIYGMSYDKWKGLQHKK